MTTRRVCENGIYVSHVVKDFVMTILTGLGVYIGIHTVLAKCKWVTRISRFLDLLYARVRDIKLFVVMQIH